VSPGDGSETSPPPVRVGLRPIANPLPLGFLALCGATFVVAGLNLGWVPPDQGRQVGLVLNAFVAPLQLVASVLGFLGRDVVAGTGMGVLTGTWLSTGLVLLTSAPGATSDALGLLLLVAATAMAVTASGAVGAKVVPALVLLTTSARFATTGLYELTASDGWKVAAGWVGVVLAFLAGYAALALVIEDAHHRTVLPLGRRGPGAAALHGGAPDQLQGIWHEAGVRGQL
jgi:succinate-acetate transporter protein